LYGKGKTFCAFSWNFLKKQENLLKSEGNERIPEPGLDFEIWERVCYNARVKNKE
jgi:hypothetical protein